MTINIYCLPGTMCDQRLWQSTQQYLPTDYILSPLPIPLGDSIADITQKLALNLPQYPINLLGFSLGGYLAASVALLNKNQIKQLMIVSNSVAALPQHEIVQRQQTLAWLAENMYRGMPKKKRLALLHSDNYNNESIHQLLLAMESTLGQAVLVNQLSATSARQDLMPELSKRSYDVSFCVGEQDNLLDIAELYTGQLNQSNITIEQILGAGHMLPLEQPKLLAKWIVSQFKS